MHGKWTRLLTLILCLTVILTPLPTGAEEIGPVIISADEVVEHSEPGQEAQPAEEAETFSQEAQAEAAPPAAADVLDGEDSGAVDAEETLQPQDGADESDIPSSSDEALSTEDGTLSTDETPEPLPEAADGLAVEFARRWVDVLDVASQQDEYHKALLLYDSLIYNYTPGSAASAVDALTGRTASAAGYALSYELLLQAVGIECDTIFEGEYAWNLARLDGAWTHIDVYADDVPEHYGFHFGLTDAAMAREHHWEGFPASTDTQLNYFVREQHYAAFTGSEDLSALLGAAIDAQAETISLYSAGAAVDIAQVLGELDPGVAGSMSTTGLYTTIHFDWAEPAPTVDAQPETEHPIVSDQTDSSPEDATPEPEALPTDWPIVDGTGDPDADWPLVDENGDAGTDWPIVDGADDVEADWPDVDESDDMDADWPVVDETGDPDADRPADDEQGDALTDESLADEMTDAETGEEPTDGAQADQDQYVNLMELIDPRDISTVSDAIEPASIEPSDASIEIGVNETKSIADWKLLPEGAQGEVSYASQSSKIATVSETGYVTGIKPGSTKLKIALNDNPDINCIVSVTVKKAPTDVTISCDRNVLGVGEEMQASYKLSSGSTGEVTFSIPEGQQNIATVTPEGLITAIAPGRFTLTAETYNDKPANELELEVKSAPTNVRLDKQTLSIGVGDKYTLSYSLDDGSAGKVSFESNAPEVAAVDPNTGEITAVATGTATVTASAYDVADATVQVNVVAAPDRVTLSAPRNTIGAGEELKLSTELFTGDAAFAGDVCRLKYSSSSASIATVDADGLVTAKKAGSATITVTAYNSTKKKPVTAKVKLTVQKAPTSLSISTDRDKLGVGEQMQASYKLSKGTTGEVIFSIPDNQHGIATVTPDGLIKAIGQGSFTLNAQTYNGTSAEALPLEVKLAPTSVTLEKESLKIGVGDKYTLNYTLSEGSAGKVSFTSDNAGAVDVNPDTGEMTAVATGKATVTVSAYNAVKATVPVDVIAAPNRVTLTAPRNTIGIGEKLQLTSQLMTDDEPYAGDITTVKYASSSASIAKVDGNGLVEAKKAGSATITVTAYNSTKKKPVTAKVKITVQKAPTGLSISTDRAELGVGEQMRASYKLPKGTTGEVIFSIPEDQRAVATVTSDGLITAVAPGTFTLNAQTFNDKPAEALTLNVKSAPTTITPDKSSLKIGVGDKYTLGYALDAGSAGKVTFEAKNPDGIEVVTVDPDTGEIAAKNIGTANVTVSAYNAVNATVQVNVIAAPNKVALTAPRNTIGIGETVQLSSQLMTDDQPYAGDITTVKYASSSTSIATVDADGLVKGKKAGAANITVTAYNSTKKAPVTAKVKITVQKAPTSLSILTDRTELGVGETIQASYKLPKSTAGEVTFSIPDDQHGIATVTPEGLIKAIGQGTFTLNAQTYNQKSAEPLTIDVKPAPTSVTPEKQSLKIGVGDKYTLNYTLSEGSAGKVSFASDNSEAVDVDPDSGEITAVATGTANVTVSAYNGTEATVRVEVIAPPNKIKLSAPRTTIGIGETLQLTSQLFTGEETYTGDITTVKYTSSSSSIAKVDDKTGLVEAKKAGAVNITVTAYNSTRKAPVTAKVKITVQKAPSSVSITADRTVLGVGEEMQLEYALPKGTTGNVTFSVPDGQYIGKVTPDGLFTAQSTGTVDVTATAYNGKSTSLTIDVKKAPTGITVESLPQKLGVGATVQLNARLTDPDSAGKICYRIANGGEYATIDENGMITAVAVGQVTLEVYTYVENVVRMAFLNVVNAPETLKLPESSITLGVGDTYTIAPIIDEGCAASFTYTVSKKDKTYVSVSPEGVVTANKAGKGTITVTTHNKRSAKLTVNVKAQPKSITVDPAELTLGVGESAALKVTLSKNSATTLTFVSDNTQIATVEPNGTVTALAEGTVNVNITTTNGLSASCAITVVDAPSAIDIDEPDVLGVGERVPLEYTLVPEDAHTTPVWEIVPGSGEDVLEIEDGELRAIREGTATLRCATHVESVADELQISVSPAPTKISFAEEEYFVELGGTLQLEPVIEPEGSFSELSYIIETEGLFDIDENGLVTPIQYGSSRIKAITYNDKSAVTTITVVDPDVPTEISFVQDPPVRMEIDESFTPELKVIPETANAEMTWTASSDVIVELDPKTGAIRAKTSGHAIIEGVAVHNPKIKLSYGVTVGSDERCLIMPSQYLVTDPGKINSVFAQINDVRDSAYAELDELCASGYITEQEMEARRNVITRAFEMYRFAWKPDATMPYWRKANSEGGKKDFKTDYIYFGIPYTQSSRQSYPQWAIQKGYYKDSGKGYYIMQTSKFDSRKYPGSDCSSFASMAVWGYTSGHRGDNTNAIASASYYKTLSAKYWQDLRPGDLICLGGHHVVIFLYYANQAKTQFVIIEQGGGAGLYTEYCNTISVSIRDQSYYQDRNYKIRRVSSCNMDFKDRV